MKTARIFEAVQALRGEIKRKDLHPVAEYNLFVEAYNHVAKLCPRTLTPAMFAALVALRMDMNKDEYRYSRLRKLVDEDPLSTEIYDEFTKIGKKIGGVRQRVAERSLYYRGILREF